MSHPTIYLRLVLHKPPDALKPAKAYIIQVEDDDRNDYQVSLFWGTWQDFQDDPLSLSRLRNNRANPRHQGQDLWSLKRTAYVLLDDKVQRHGYSTIEEHELRL